MTELIMEEQNEWKKKQSMNQQNRSYIVPSASRIAIRLAVSLLFSLLFAAIVAINFCLTTHFRVDKKCAIIF